MIHLWYADISDVSEFDFNKKLESLPSDIQKGILSYRFFNDRKLKLYGRLIIKDYLETNNILCDWSKLRFGKYGKPYFNGIEFNISHSGTIVIVGFSNDPIGVDIEYKKAIEVADLSMFFHEDEKTYLNKSTDKIKAFYHVWTRKEAFLKAIGNGISNRFNRDNCLYDELNYGGKHWLLRSLKLLDEYYLSICSTNIDCVEFKQFDITKKEASNFFNGLKVI